MTTIVFATLKNTFDKNPVAREMPLDAFVEFICDTSKRLSVNPEWTKEEYDTAKIKQKAIAPAGGRRKDGRLESGYIGLDFDHLKKEQFRNLKRTFRAAPFFNIFHTTASHKHECKGGDYACRVIIPTARAYDSNDAAAIQFAIMDELGIEQDLRDHCTDDANRMIYLPHAESEITVSEGRLLRPHRYIARAEELGFSAKAKRELTKDETGINSDIAHFCEAELGLDALSSGRGYEVPCPNQHLHTGKGSTSIMLDGKEVRFVCQHTNNGACSALNRRQHLALRVCGLPDELNVAKQPISLNTIREALPDLSDDEVTELHEAENKEPVAVTEDDVEDVPEVAAERIEVIDGLLATGESFYICAKSHTGKSTFSLGMDAAIASRERYAFGGAEVAEGHTFVFAGEGAAALERHKTALQITLGDSLDRLHIINGLEDGNEINLLDDAWCNKAMRMMRRVAGDEPILKITFDTLQTCIPGLEENDNKLMKEAGQALNRMASRMNAAVGAMVHPVKSTNGSLSGENSMLPKGGSDFHNSIDTALFLHKPNEARPYELNLHHTKNRSGMRQATVGFVLQRVQIAEPVIKPAPTHKFVTPPQGYETSSFVAAESHMDVWVNFTALRAFQVELDEDGTTTGDKNASKKEVKKAVRNATFSEFEKEVMYAVVKTYEAKQEVTTEGELVTFTKADVEKTYKTEYSKKLCSASNRLFDRMSAVGLCGARNKDGTGDEYLFTLSDRFDRNKFVELELEKDLE